ncbi:MAG: hypothetical protein B7Y42_00440 [Polaromonas sp. 28-63-22]|jgi:hypothetical protein|nr:MAG: hypothetical protein B7Y42_00440 [Polaromonas sp. 28-63-22]
MLATPLATTSSHAADQPATYRPIDLVVIHCAATPSGKPLQQGKPGTPGFLNAPQVINAWHAARGFSRQRAAVAAFNGRLPSIGYHFVIDLTGEVWTGRGLNEVGAHAAQFNARSVGICLVGGAEREAQYTAKQWKSLREVVTMLLMQRHIPLAPPQRVPDKASPLGYMVRGGICGHRDLSPDGNGNGLIEPFEWTKTCPGFDVRAWLARGMEPPPGQICEARP